LVALGLVALVLIGATLWFAVLVYTDQHSSNGDRDAALAAARQVVVDYTTYDYTKLDTQFKHLSSEFTGPLKADFVQKQSALTEFLKSGKGKAQGQVVEVAITFQHGNQISIIAVADQAVANTALPSGKLNRFRFHIVMAKQHGHWLATTLAPA
jgi:Mce-associated membrane protein